MDHNSAVCSDELYDVAVIGAGTAGAIAAISAARQGARVVAVEQSGYVGGVLGLGMSFLGPVDGEGYWALGGIGREVVERAREWGGAVGPFWDPKVSSKLAQDPEILKLMLLELLQEAGVDLLLQTQLVGATSVDGTVSAVSIANKGGVGDLRARTYVDCTGDADVVAMAGGAFQFGREPDHLAQPVSRIFRVGGVDLGRMYDYLREHPEDRLGVPSAQGPKPYSVDYLEQTPGSGFEGFRTLIAQAKEAGDFPIPRNAMIIYTYPGRHEVGINVTRVQGIDATDPIQLSRAEVESQLQVLAVLRFLRTYVPGFENAYLSAVPGIVGVRESRHITGHFTLTQEDVFAGADFPDQIGRCSYPFDIHDVVSDPETGRKAGGNIKLSKIEKSFGIPLRALLPIDLANVSVGGRCISADHAAASSIRGQAPCMVSGEAAGAVAALGATAKKSLIDVPAADVQTAIRAQGGVLERVERMDDDTAVDRHAMTIGVQ